MTGYRRLPIGSPGRIARNLLQFAWMIASTLGVEEYGDPIYDWVALIAFPIGGRAIAEATVTATFIALFAIMFLFGIAVIAAVFGTRMFFQVSD